jgi:hypothetical protein
VDTGYVGPESCKIWGPLQEKEYKITNTKVDEKASI